MRWLTDKATLKCDHGGSVDVAVTQDFVRIARRRVLVRPDPEKRPIRVCPNDNPVAGIVACHNTLDAREGYSEFVRIAGHSVCLDTILGYTDGMPPGATNYKVADPGQDLVEADR